MKQFYSGLYIEIIKLQDSDVITASSGDPNVWVEDNDVVLGGWEE